MGQKRDGEGSTSPAFRKMSGCCLLPGLRTIGSAGEETDLLINGSKKDKFYSTDLNHGLSWLNLNMLIPGKGS